MLQLMPLFSHADGLKASLWIDPAAHQPAWPSCGHVNSFSAYPLPQSHSTLLPASPIKKTLTRAETIWTVYRDWILHGQVDPSVGEYRIWRPEDEFDPLERSEVVYSFEGEPVRPKKAEARL